MSENENYLDLEQAKSLAGVGLETILRYRDLGLLRVYTVDGKEKFSEEDVRLLFNSKITAGSQPETQVKDRPSDPAHKSDAPKADSTPDTPKKSQIAKDTEPDLPRLSDIVREEEEKHSTENSTSGRSKSILSSVTKHASDRSDLLNVSFHQEDASGKRFISTLGQHNPLMDISSIELLELTRSLKDQLEIVKDERNWLRRRVEKLESQAEREQMIVMSETETIRSLVLQRETAEKRKSPWAFLLSWTRPAEHKALEQSSNNKPQDKSQA